MAPIPCLAYIIIGAVVASFSKFVEIRSKQNMNLFFYAGLFFVAVGIIKISAALLRKKSPGNTRHSSSQHRRMEQHHHNQHIHPSAHNKHQHPHANKGNQAWQSSMNEKGSLASHHQQSQQRISQSNHVHNYALKAPDTQPLQHRQHRHSSIDAVHGRQGNHENYSHSRQVSLAHHVSQVANPGDSDHPSLQNIIDCPRCNARHYAFANYCMVCGFKLK
jgi:hypothetical protein